MGAAGTPTPGCSHTQWDQLGVTGYHSHNRISFCVALKCCCITGSDRLRYQKHLKMPMRAGNGEVYGGGVWVILRKQHLSAWQDMCTALSQKGLWCLCLCAPVCVNVFAAAGHTLPPIIRRYDRWEMRWVGFSISSLLSFHPRTIPPRLHDVLKQHGSVTEGLDFQPQGQTQPGLPLVNVGVRKGKVGNV